MVSSRQRPAVTDQLVSDGERPSLNLNRSIPGAEFSVSEVTLEAGRWNLEA
jgi:hypothetical protein